MKTKYNCASLLLLAFCMSFSIVITAQSVSFGYDASGNRTSRDIIYLKSSEYTDQELNEQQLIEVLSTVEVTISPNPNGGRFKVSLKNLSALKTENLQEGPARLQLFLHHLSGNLVFEIKELNAINEVDISDRENGTYILTIFIGGERRTWKVIKQ